MRAKIMMLAEKERFREDLKISQQTLTAVAVAFGQSLAMKEAVFGRDSMKNAADEARDCDAVIALGDMEALERMAHEMGCYAAENRFDHPGDLGTLSRLKISRPRQASFIRPLTPSETHLTRAAAAACAGAKETGGRLVIIPPDDAASAWKNIASKAAMFSALQMPRAATLEEAVSLILSEGEEQTVFLCSSRAARVLNKISCYLDGLEALAYTAFLSETKTLYAVPSLKEGGGIGLFAALYATADLLRRGLRLRQEGDCLNTAVDNVLASGWRTAEIGLNGKTVSSDEILRLVSEQVALAGELFERLR